MKETLKAFLIQEKNQITAEINKLKSNVFMGEISQREIDIRIQEKENHLRSLNAIIELCLNRGRF